MVDNNIVWEELEHELMVKYNELDMHNFILYGFDIEEQIIKAFVIFHPYPTYDEIYNMICDMYTGSSSNLYDGLIHIYFKRIYDNPTDKKIIIIGGTNLYKYGGINLLITYYNILQTLLISYNIKNRIILSILNRITNCWNICSSKYNN